MDYKVVTILCLITQIVPCAENNVFSLVHGYFCGLVCQEYSVEKKITIATFYVLQSPHQAPNTVEYIRPFLEIYKNKSTGETLASYWFSGKKPAFSKDV